MKNRNSSLIKNFSYSFVGNLLTMFVSALGSLIIPKFIGVEDYGYWQLFLFYSSYLSFAQFGWSDGIYLRFGGEKIENLDKVVFKGQSILFSIFQFIITLILIVYANLVITNENYANIANLLALSLFIGNLLNLTRIIFEAVANFKASSFSIMIDRLLYLFLIIVLILSGNVSSKLIIIADLIGKITALLITLYYFKPMLISKSPNFGESIIEAKKNIKVGINLMLSNISNMLIIGIPRFGIEKFWSITTFAKISLILNLSNLITKFVNTIGLVLFPYLKNTGHTKQTFIYTILRSAYTYGVLMLFLFFYPLKELMMWWLPEYSESLEYMSILFPISLFQGKMALLITPFIKALRKEKQMLKINIITLVLSFILAMVTILVARNLYLAITSIVISLAFRSYIAENLLSQTLKFHYWKHRLLEGVVIISFSLLGLYSSTLTAMLLYTLVLSIYLFINRKDFFNLFYYIKKAVQTYK